MTDGQKALALLGAIAAVGVVGSGLNYVHVAHTERKKRAKIEEWRLENLACIENSRERLVKIAWDRNRNSEDFWTALKEEDRFLNIVRNQPKY